MAVPQNRTTRSRRNMRRSHDALVAANVISVDAMGGDRGPATVVAGLAVSAAKNPDIRFILHGPEPELTRLVSRRRQLAGRCEIRHCDGVVRMDDKPSQVMRNGQGTSMWSAIEAVRGARRRSACPAATPAR
jgi:phosphate acyltransferase